MSTVVAASSTSSSTTRQSTESNDESSQPNSELFCTSTEQNPDQNRTIQFSPAAPEVDLLFLRKQPQKSIHNSTNDVENSIDQLATIEPLKNQDFCETDVSERCRNDMNETDAQHKREDTVEATIETQLPAESIKHHDLILPNDLKDILSEVARTGKSSIPWRKPVHSGSNGAFLPNQLGNRTQRQIGSHGGLLYRDLDIAGQKRHRPLSSVSRLENRQSLGSHQLMQLHGSLNSNGGSSSTTTTATFTTETGISLVSSGNITSNPSQNHLDSTSVFKESSHFRNGVHSLQSVKKSLNRQRPQLVIRTQTNNASLGGERNSGSEHEEASQYECDSEGTSATSNSEISFEYGRRAGNSNGYGRSNERRASRQRSRDLLLQKIGSGEECVSKYRQGTSRCICEAVCQTINLVLDHYFMYHGGYTLSPVEMRIYSIAAANEGCFPSENTKKHEKIAFEQRKERLMKLLGRFSDKYSEALDEKVYAIDAGPFTIQRVAEVLCSPERYYSQTHKLCNCLEKLLLVTSSTQAFGGSKGGDISQAQIEGPEAVAYSDGTKKARPEFRLLKRRQRRKTGSPAADAAEALRFLGNQSIVDEPMHSAMVDRESFYNDEEYNSVNASTDNSDLSRETLEASARASLRTKFDHAGMDPHSSVVSIRDIGSLVEGRSMTKSPPPPSPTVTLGSGIHNGLLRQHNHGSSTSPTSPGKDIFSRSLSPTHFYGTGCDIASSINTPIHPNPTHTQHLAMQHSTTGTNLSPFQVLAVNANITTGSMFGPAATSREVDIESRSSASSDIDSESDVSFDDSASDRSDGSDSGQLEPFSAARAMALNRMQQQQRLQSRVLTSMHMYGTGGDGFRPPADSEYQSGDSIDSTRAEDSGGSDSSSSDLAD